MWYMLQPSNAKPHFHCMHIFMGSMISSNAASLTRMHSTNPQWDRREKILGLPCNWCLLPCHIWRMLSILQSLGHQRMQQMHNRHSLFQTQLHYSARNYSSRCNHQCSTTLNKNAANNSSWQNQPNTAPATQVTSQDIPTHCKEHDKFAGRENN